MKARVMMKRVLSGSVALGLVALAGLGGCVAADSGYSYGTTGAYAPYDYGSSGYSPGYVDPGYAAPYTYDPGYPGYDPGLQGGIFLDNGGYGRDRYRDGDRYRPNPNIGPQPRPGAPPLPPPPASAFRPPPVAPQRPGFAGGGGPMPQQPNFPTQLRPMAAPAPPPSRLGGAPPGSPQRPFQ